MSNVCLRNAHLFLPSQAEYKHYHAMTYMCCNARIKKKGKKTIQDINSNDTPTVKQAMEMADCEEWKKAIRHEIGSLLKDTLKEIDIKSLEGKTFHEIATTMQ